MPKEQQKRIFSELISVKLLQQTEIYPTSRSYTNICEGTAYKK